MQGGHFALLVISVAPKSLRHIGDQRRQSECGGPQRLDPALRSMLQGPYRRRVTPARLGRGRRAPGGGAGSALATHRGS